MKKYVLSLDEGTTSARAILFDRESNIISMSQHEFPQIYPRPGWGEQDPMEIYANQYAAMTECIAKSGVDADEIAAVGITNQRETVIAWNKKTGRPNTWFCLPVLATFFRRRRSGGGQPPQHGRHPSYPPARRRESRWR